MTTKVNLTACNSRAGAASKHLMWVSEEVLLFADIVLAQSKAPGCIAFKGKLKGVLPHQYYYSGSQFGLQRKY